MVSLVIRPKVKEMSWQNKKITAHNWQATMEEKTKECKTAVLRITKHQGGPASGGCFYRMEHMIAQLNKIQERMLTINLGKEEQPTEIQRALIEDQM